MKIKAKLYLWLLCLFSMTLHAQEVITTSGGYGETTSARVTWTIGEPVPETIIGTNTILNQGFNQGDLTLTIIKDPSRAGIDVLIYPNPAIDELMVSVEDTDAENLRYVLIDMSGKMLSESKMQGYMTHIAVNKLAPASYILKIYQNKKEIGVFKIVKK